MPSCVIRYCRNYSTKTLKSQGITYHSFPVDKERCMRWVELVRAQRNEDFWEPSLSSKICSLHFKDEDKHTSSKGRVIIKRHAIPVLDSSLASTITQAASTSDGTQAASTVDGKTSQNNAIENASKSIPTTPPRDNSMKKRNIQESWSGCASGNKRKIKLPEGQVLISRVYHFLCDEYEQLKALCPGCDLSPLSDLVARTSKATGVSLNIVTDILLEEKRAQQPTDSDDDVSPMEEEPSEGEDVEAPKDTAMTETQEQEDEDKETQEATFNLMTETQEQEDEVDEQTQPTTYIEQPEDEEIETLKVEIYDDEYQCSAGEAAGDDSHVNVKIEPPDEQLTLSSAPCDGSLAAEVPHAEVKAEPHTEYPSDEHPNDNIGDKSQATRDTKRQKPRDIKRQKLGT